MQGTFLTLKARSDRIASYLWTHGETFPLRLAVVLIALLILYLRVPESLADPHFWAEDGVVFFYGARSFGWKAIFSPAAGYMCSLQWLVALAASYLPLSAAPLIYNYVGVFLTLTVVWLVTSPRLDLPLKPLLAIAVVAVVQGTEVLGTMANVQWIVPIGVFVLLFMRPAKSPIILIAEVVFAAVVAVTGPFSIFLAPLFLVRLVMVRNEPGQCARLGILTVVMVAGAVVEAGYLIYYHDYAFIPYGVPPLPYPWSLWVSLPVSRILEGFGPRVMWMFNGTQGAVLGLVLGALIAWLATLRPFRAQKIFMLLFAGAIAVTGLIKYRESLPMLGTTQRYFYASSIFLVWFFCCCTAHTKLRDTAVVLVIISEIIWVKSELHTGRARIDADLREWKVWAQYIPTGLAVSIPIDPPGWLINVPADPSRRPLGQYNSWIGKNLGEVAGQENTQACGGGLQEVRPLSEVHGTKPRWVAKGWAWNVAKNEPVELVALVDPQDTIVAFGLPGFSRPKEISAEHDNSGWMGLFLADKGVTVRAVALLDGGKTYCRLGNALPLQSKAK